MYAPSFITPELANAVWLAEIREDALDQASTVVVFGRFKRYPTSASALDAFESDDETMLADLDDIADLVSMSYTATAALCLAWL